MATANTGKMATREALYNLPDIFAGDELSDVIIEVNSQRFNLHRVILASCSDFFRAMFCGQMRESTDDVIPLSYDSLTTEAFKILVDFAYKSKLNLTNDNVFEVFMAADHLQMLGAMTLCGEFILDLVEDMTIPVSHLLTIAEFITKYDIPKVKEKLTKSMARQFTHLAETKEFSEAVTCERLAELLERDDLVAGSEAEIFRIVLKWVEADEENRIGHLGELLRRVRLPLIDPNELTDLMDTDRFRELPCYQLYIGTLKSHAKCHAIADLNHKPRNSTKVFAKVNFLQTTYLVSYRQGKKWKDLTFYGFKHNISQKSEYLQTAVVGNTLVVVHGSGAMHKFNPEAIDWTELQPMKECRENFLFVHDGGEYLYALGGEVDGNAIRAAERYNLHSGKWQRISPLPEGGGKNAAATVHEDKIVYLCNQTGYSFDAEQNQWEEMLTYDAEFRSPVFATVIRDQLHLFKTWNGKVQVHGENGDAAWGDVDQGGIPDMWKSRAFRGVDDQVYIIGGTRCYPADVYVDPDDPYDVDIDDWKWMMETAEKSNIVEMCIRK